MTTSVKAKLNKLDNLKLTLTNGYVSLITQGGTQDYSYAWNHSDISIDNFSDLIDSTVLTQSSKLALEP